MHGPAEGPQGRASLYGQRFISILPGVLGAISLVGLAVLGLAGCPGGSGISNATCLQCHDGRTAQDQTDFHESVHGRFDCQRCHDEGAEAHVRSGGQGGIFIFNPADLPFAQANAFCAECHAHTDEHAGFTMSAHAATQAVGCNGCHDVHAENSMAVNLDDGPRFSNEEYAALCGQCHETAVDQYFESVHSEFATCVICHDMHVESQLRVPAETNLVCLQCHVSSTLGFVNDEVVDAHTGFFHPVDPAGSGASRCTGCHMVPDAAFDEDSTRSHTFLTVPPQVSVEAIQDGAEAVPPNSCAGVTGCHDPAVPGSGQPHLPTDLQQNIALQDLYEAIGFVPE